MSDKNNWFPYESCNVIPPYRDGLVLKGYDVVEYHNLDKSDKGIPGTKEFSYNYNNSGANNLFYFKNQENLDKFTENPIKYIPQFGGFCSWGFANEWGAMVDGNQIGDPEVPPDCNECINNPPWPWTKTVMGPPADPNYGWSVYKEKLYFNINSGYRKLWEETPDIFIERANNRWEKYYGWGMKYASKIGPLNVASYPDTWQESTTLNEKQQWCLDHSVSF